MTKLAEFQKMIDYQFANEALLIQALTHKSFCVDQNKKSLHNEKLEFLGDSILNFVIADELIKRHSDEQEGVLSKKRAALVNHNMLAQIALKYKLENFMFFGPGEVKQGSHLNSRIQGSCIEALIGAVYADSNFEKARSWVLQQYTDGDFEIVDGASFEADYKSRLQELTRKHGLGTPVYELIFTSGPSHKPLFLIALKLNDEEKTRAEGFSKKNAEQKAAKELLAMMTKTYGE